MKTMSNMVLSLSLVGILAMSGCSWSHKLSNMVGEDLVKGGEQAQAVVMRGVDYVDLVYDGGKDLYHYIKDVFRYLKDGPQPESEGQ